MRIRWMESTSATSWSMEIDCHTNLVPTVTRCPMEFVEPSNVDSDVLLLDVDDFINEGIL